jgi:hypothetical protein
MYRFYMQIISSMLSKNILNRGKEEKIWVVFVWSSSSN